MGYYIETECAKGKAKEIAHKYNGLIVDYEQARLMMEQPTSGVIVIMDNGPFEAAGFAFSADEFRAFTCPTDTRPKAFVVIDRGLAEKLTGYNR